MSLTTPESIQKLQRKLYLKAKQEPTFRFYSLYDKIYRTDILKHAYALVRTNAGAPGVDGITFEKIKAYGLEKYLVELQEEFRERRYRPQAVRRVVIPKPNGGERPLGIPTIRDRVAQAAVKLVLEPIFEADFTDNAYAYRPQRNALQAVREVHTALKAGYVQVVDADVSKYFDTIPHADLMRSVARRVSDGQVLHVIKVWLKAPIEEGLEVGPRIRRQAGNRGTPQGGVLSPLLANIYMRRFLKAWEERGNEQRYGSCLVNYADDFVILCRGQAQGALQEAKRIMDRLGLALNESKTRILNAWHAPFDFLGYSFGVNYSFGGGRPYMAAYPSQASVCQLKAKLRRMTGSSMNWQHESETVAKVNRVMRGWMNYFSYGTLWKTYSKLEHFLLRRIRGHLVRKHKVESRGECRFPASYLYKTLGLVAPVPASFRAR